MKEYDIYVPLCYNDGSPIEQKKLAGLPRELLRQFGGVTLFPQSNKGFWRVGGVTYRDEIVIYRVMSDDVRSARRFLRELKERLQRELDQEQLLIIEKEAKSL